jgi:hypothetical protein
LAVIVVVAFGAVQFQRSPSTPKLPSAQLASYYEAAVDVSNSTLAAVGLPSTVAIPTKVTPSLSTVATNGIVSYVGASTALIARFNVGRYSSRSQNLACSLTSTTRSSLLPVTSIPTLRVGALSVQRTQVSTSVSIQQS